VLARTKPFAHGFHFSLNKAGSTGPRKLDISWPTTEFTKMVKGWDKFDEVKMGISVRHIKSSALPDSLFDPGERQLKPVVKKRPKQVKPAEKTNVSPDLPAPKKLRYALQWTSDATPSCFDATSERPSYNLSSDLTSPSAQAGKPAENGTLSIPRTPDTAVVVTAAPTPVYSVDIKDPTNIKSPLPFKESVAVATATSVP
jgi:poly(A) polymerase